MSQIVENSVGVSRVEESQADDKESAVAVNRRHFIEMIRFDVLQF